MSLASTAVRSRKRGPSSTRCKNVHPCATAKSNSRLCPTAAISGRVGHRYLTGVNPECMGRFAHEMAHKGVRLIGGCCEVHPPHVHEMHSYLHSLAAGESTVPLARTSDQQPTDAAAKRRNGPFSRKLVEGQFAVSVELLPPRGTGGLKARLAFVAELAALTAYRAQVPIVVGVMVLRGLEHARRIAEVPGVVVPEKIFARLAVYADPADQAKAGVELAAEQVRQVRAEGWSGLYLMSPAGHQPVLEVLKQGLD